MLTPHTEYNHYILWASTNKNSHSNKRRSIVQALAFNWLYISTVTFQDVIINHSSFSYEVVSFLRKRSIFYEFWHHCGMLVSGLLCSVNWCWMNIFNTFFPSTTHTKNKWTHSHIELTPMELDLCVLQTLTPLTGLVGLGWTELGWVGLG